MKSKSILLASIALLGVTHFASAQVTLRVTGSTAFRSATVNGIRNVMTFSNAGEGYGFSGTSFTGAAAHYFIGQVPTVAGAGTVTIKTNWSGSVAGIQNVSAGNAIAFIADGTAVTSAGMTGLATSVNEVPDIAMADNKQSSTIYTSPSIQFSSKVGIIPFAFVAGASTLAGVTSINQQQADALLSEGRLPTSVFTGNSADAQFIYATGRDPSSGTRLVTLAESKHGTQTVVKQYRPTGGAIPANGNVNSIEFFPVNGTIVPDLGNDGFPGGGGVADLLRAITTGASATPAGVTDTVRSANVGVTSFIGYIGESDTYSAVFGSPFSTLTATNQANARYLSYNGVSAFGGVAKRPGNTGTPVAGNQPTWTSGSAVITLANTGTVNDASGFVPGQIVSGTGIAPGSTILSVDSTTQITLDKNTIAPPPALASTNLQVGALLPKNLRNGSYTFWNYEYILWKTGTAGSNIVGTSGVKRSVADVIRTEITNNTYSFSGLADEGISPVTVSSFRAQRTEDGGYVFPK